MSSQTFEEYKDTLEKEPTDPDAKKEYIVGCYTSDDWIHIHQVLQGVIMRNPTVPAFLHRIDGIAGIPGGIVGLIKPVVIEFLKIQSQS